MDLHFVKETKKIKSKRLSADGKLERVRHIEMRGLVGVPCNKHLLHLLSDWQYRVTAKLTCSVDEHYCFHILMRLVL